MIILILLFIYNLLKKKMPACFFFAVSDDVNGVSSYSMESFVEFFQKNKECKY